MTDLTEKRCLVCEGGTPALNENEAAALLKQIEGWEMISSGKEIVRNFSFKNYYHTMAFVNALAWIAHQENHHPDIEVGYNHCRVRYSTHAVDGLTENDFICAAKVNKLLGS